MKKWYVITGILALLLTISLGTCSSNSVQVEELKAKLADTTTELTVVRGDLASATTELKTARAELEQWKISLARWEVSYNSLKAQNDWYRRVLIDTYGWIP